MADLESKSEDLLRHTRVKQFFSTCGRRTIIEKKIFFFCVRRIS